METTTPNLGGVKRDTVMEFGMVLKGAPHPCSPLPLHQSINDPRVS